MSLSIRTIIIMQWSIYYNQTIKTEMHKISGKIQNRVLKYI